jgi:hypothetical protein
VGTFFAPLTKADSWSMREGGITGRNPEPVDWSKGSSLEPFVQARSSAHGEPHLSGDRLEASERSALARERGFSLSVWMRFIQRRGRQS